MTLQKGFTLIETVIYLALFAIVIGGGMVATYQIIQSSAGSNNHIIMEEEANFLLRKINWALVGAALPNTKVLSGTSLQIQNNTGSYTFDLCGNYLVLQSGLGQVCPNPLPTNILLNSSSVKVLPGTIFSSLGSSGFQVNFTLETVQVGKKVTESFSTTKYVRQ